MKFFTKNIALIIVIIFLTLTTLTVSAREFLVSKEYKPTTQIYNLLSKDKQPLKEKNQNKLQEIKKEDNQETKLLTFINQSSSGELNFIDDQGINYTIINIDQSAIIKPPINGWLDISTTKSKYQVTGFFKEQTKNIYFIEATKVQKVLDNISSVSRSSDLSKEFIKSQTNQSSIPSTTNQSINNQSIKTIDGIEFIFSEIDTNGDILLQKTDPDGYYVLKDLSLEAKKIKYIKQTYKIWGKIKNRAIIEVTKVEEVNLGNFKINLSPKNYSKFQKEVTTRESKDCDIQPGIVSYFAKDEKATMLINNDNLPTTYNYLQSKEILNNYLIDKSQYLSNLHLYFIHNCSIYNNQLVYNRLVQELNIKYPNTDISKVLYVNQGQSIFGTLSIVIFAKKEDNYIYIFAPLSKEDSFNQKASEDISKECQKFIKSNDLAQANICWKQKANNPKYLDQAKKRAQELIDLFTI